MVVWGPATFVVLLIAGVFLVVGAVLLGGARREREEPRGMHVCQGCGHANRRNARFCARCGQNLRRGESHS